MAKNKKTSVRTQTDSTTVNPEEKIRQRAYELYDARGRAEGHDFDDWLQAEAEITGTKRRIVAP